MRPTSIVFFLAGFLLPLTIFSQRPSIDDFTLVGDTYLTTDECFRLTEAIDYASGSIWYKYPVSLAEPFVVELNVLLGCEDEGGADGMVFVMTPQQNQLGYMGEGIGFAGMAPSIGIELDTWINYHLNDPVEDHIAIMANGRVGHRNDLAGPTPLPNLEDCALHSLVIFWDPSNQRLSVEIDNTEVIAAQYDIIGGIFGGKDEIYWGITAATGRYNNIHEVCFDRTVMLPEAPDRHYWGK